MNYWLFKSEPDTFSFDDLKSRPKRREPWSGVRGFQARNYMRDEMALSELGFFYHSSCPVPGIAGILRVASKPYADPTQFDRKSEYFDPKSKPENPTWMMVDVEWHADLPNFVSLEQLKREPALAGMITLQRGNRLSITPVEEAHFRLICKMGGWKP